MVAVVSSDTTSLVVALTDPAAKQLTLTGGKGSSLAELVADGLPVPGGFVVTTTAYRRATEESELGTRIREALSSRGIRPEVAGPRIRAVFAALELPDDLSAGIVASLEALGSPAVAVRSSATAEDLPGASFAGQQDSYLNVQGTEAVLDAVRDCWASLWTDRALSYRRIRSVDSSQVEIAVVIQTMVDADAAGVMFTADVSTGERDVILVEASPGLGEAVVSGLVTPDRYRLREDGVTLEEHPGRREVVIRSLPNGGTEVVRGSASDDGDTALTDGTRADPVLTVPQRARLAELGIGIAHRRGVPQDIEWTLAGDTISIVQSRPLTALPPAPIRLSRVQRITGPVIAELVPARPFPMDMSAWILPGVGRLLTQMVEGILGVTIDLAEALPEVDGVVDRFVPPTPHPTPRVLGALARVPSRAIRFDPARWRDDPRYDAYRQRVAALDSIPAADLSWSMLLDRPRAAWAALELLTRLRVDYLPRCGADLAALRIALSALGREGAYSSLIATARTRTRDFAEALAGLSALVRSDPELSALFSGSDSAAAAGRTDSDTSSRIVWALEAPDAPVPFVRFRTAVGDFLAEYGHRETTSLLYISSPTWSDDPAITIGAVRALLGRSPTSSPSDGARAVVDSVLTEESFASRPWLARRLRTLIAAAAEGTKFREDSHFELTRVMPAIRQAVLEMGARLSAAGALADPQEVWHLRLEDFRGVPDPATPTDEVEGLAEPLARLRALVTARRSAREQRAGAPLIAATTLFPDLAERRESLADTALATGTPLGGGRAEGTVRIIRGPEDFGRLGAGEILVCPATNPAWTPLFGVASAVVVDTGGAGSHAAIVAREYGLPAVMGTGDGTSVLADGARVAVDGDLGIVEAMDA